MSYPVILTTKSVTVTVDGVPLKAHAGTVAYEDAKEAIREGNWDEIPRILQPEKAIEHYSDGSMRVEDGQVLVDVGEDNEFAVPVDLNDMILDHMEERIPLEHLVNFAKNLSKNPSYRSVQQLFTFIEKNDITITPEGNFIAYKGVSKSFMDCYTGEIDNSVGATVEMPRNQVNEDPDQTCSHGLHAAEFDYAHQYYGGHSNGHTVFVEINPADVVAVPRDYNNAKMRVCKYKVLGLVDAPLQEKVWTPDVEEKEDYDDSYAEVEQLELNYDNCSDDYSDDDDDSDW
jgi:hypothetical protein